MQLVTPTPQETPPEAVEQTGRAGDFVNLDIDIEPFLPEYIQPFWDFLQDYPLLLVLIMAVLGYLVGKAVQWAVRGLMLQAARRTQSKLDDQFVHYLTEPVVQTGVILGLVAAEKAFGFSETVDWVLVRMLFSVLIFLWGRAWFKATSLAISALVRRESTHELLQPRTRPLFEMSIKVFLFGLLVWLFMSLW
ncbi:MAG: hypothetical protein HKP02_14545, partial [Xanthomonadales bacterium]|nr:hypothetical protein [Xanthomonadales bacterium]